MYTTLTRGMCIALETRDETLRTIMFHTPVRFSTISGALTSEILENLEEIFPRYYIRNDRFDYTLVCQPPRIFNCN